MAEGDDKTESATPRRVEKARDEGQVAVSRDLSLLLSLAAGLVAIAAQSDPARIMHFFASALQQTRYAGESTWRAAALAILLPVIPVALAAWAGTVVTTLAQTDFLLYAGGLQPDLSRISPLKGLKRLFGAETLVAVLKAIAKLAVFAACLWVSIGQVLPSLPTAALRTPGALYSQILRAGTRLALMLLAAQAAIALADTVWERFHLARKLRMTRQEQRDEHKDSDGNPHVRQRLRQLARNRARKRMIQAVPKAAVVITNPTHYAIALQYQRGAKGAPRVVAKGADEVAERIREVAREHRVPIIANPPLARALFRLDIDTEIPAEHFKAVAEIIAYVWRMRAQALRR
jgi:flagellar biosynthetic protein FlhB